MAALHFLILVKSSIKIHQKLCWNNFTFFKHKSQDSSYVEYQNAQEVERHEAEVLAAKRSLITNLILTTLCIGTCLAIVALAPAFAPYFAGILFAVIKSALPIFTTIANFGTVWCQCYKHLVFFCLKSLFILLNVHKIFAFWKTG